MKTNREDIKQPSDNIFCNKCGMSCLNMQGGHNGLIEAEVVGGYDSTHIDDGDVYIFSLCEKCLREIFDDCKLNPHAGNYMFAEDASRIDRHKYWGPDVKLWEDFSPEEIEKFKKDMSHPEYFGTLHSWLKEYPRDELIVYLYDLERKPDPTNQDLECIKTIKDILEEKNKKHE